MRDAVVPDPPTAPGDVGENSASAAASQRQELVDGGPAAPVRRRRVALVSTARVEPREEAAPAAAVRPHVVRSAVAAALSRRRVHGLSIIARRAAVVQARVKRHAGAAPVRKAPSTTLRRRDHAFPVTTRLTRGRPRPPVSTATARGDHGQPEPRSTTSARCVVIPLSPATHVSIGHNVTAAYLCGLAEYLIHTTAFIMRIVHSSVQTAFPEVWVKSLTIAAVILRHHVHPAATHLPLSWIIHLPIIATAGSGHNFRTSTAHVRPWVERLHVVAALAQKYHTLTSAAFLSRGVVCFHTIAAFRRRSHSPSTAHLSRLKDSVIATPSLVHNLAIAAFLCSRIPGFVICTTFSS